MKLNEIDFEGESFRGNVFQLFDKLKAEIEATVSNHQYLEPEKLTSAYYNSFSSNADYQTNLSSKVQTTVLAAIHKVEPNLSVTYFPLERTFKVFNNYHQFLPKDFDSRGAAIGAAYNAVYKTKP